jgi:hypothetical protein
MTYADIVAWAERVEGSAIGMAIAESRYAFALIEGVHLIGLSIAVGLLIITDLRLMGLFLKRVPVDDVVRTLRPYVVGGFLAIFITGGLLFWSSAARMVTSPAFLIKLVLIVLAGLNAAYFELVIARRHAQRPDPLTLPRAYRYAGFASLSLWTLVIVFGRLIPYLSSAELQHFASQ